MRIPPQTAHSNLHGTALLTSGTDLRILRFGLMAMVGAAVLFWGPNLGLILGAILALLICVRLTWRRGEFPVLAFVAIYQWLEIALAPILASVMGVEVNALYATGGNVSTAVSLSLVGVVVLCIGMKVGAGTCDPEVTRRAGQSLRQIPIIAFLKLYGLALVIGVLALLAARAVPGLSQPLLVLDSMKMAALVLVTFGIFTRQGGKTTWLFVLILALILSFGGYFSGFKFVFIYGFIGVAAAGARMSRYRRVALVAIVVGALFLGSVWTAIKPSYRFYVSGGESAQIVTTTLLDTATFAWNEAVSLDNAALTAGFETMLLRLASVDMFSVALDYVPAFQPHSKGALLIDGVSRPFMPRILFPDKAIIDESALTNRYTGLAVAGMSEGTQIGLGYFGESYVDFGAIGMFGSIAFVGLLYGWLYRYFALRGSALRRAIGASMMCIIVVPSATVGVSLAKLFGGVIVAALVSLLVISLVEKWLMQQRRAEA